MVTGGNKLFWFQFYPSDWRKDSQLSMASFATRGIWIEMICAMWEAPERGAIQGTSEQLCRLIGCSPAEFSTFLIEAKTLTFATVREMSASQDGIVHIECRRMLRDEKQRERYRIQKRNQRGSGVEAHSDAACPPVVRSASIQCPPVYSELELKSETNTKTCARARSVDDPPKSGNGKKRNDYPSGFEAFWKIYPRPDGKMDAFGAWKKLTAEEHDQAVADVPRRIHANWAGRPLDKIPYACRYLSKRLFDEAIVDEQRFGGGAQNGIAPDCLPPTIDEIHADLRAAR